VSPQGVMTREQATYSPGGDWYTVTDVSLECSDSIVRVQAF